MSWDSTIGVNQPKEPGGLCLHCGLQRSWASNFFPEKNSMVYSAITNYNWNIFFCTNNIIMTGMLITVQCF